MGVWAVAGWESGLEPFLVSENAIFFTPVQQGVPPSPSNTYYSFSERIARYGVRRIR